MNTAQQMKTRVYCTTCGGNVELQGGPPPLCHDKPMVERKPYHPPTLRSLGKVHLVTGSTVADAQGRRKPQG
jgi:hypothetical protein